MTSIRYARIDNEKRLEPGIIIPTNTLSYFYAPNTIESDSGIGSEEGDIVALKIGGPGVFRGIEFGEWSSNETEGETGDAGTTNMAFTKTGIYQITCALALAGDGIHEDSFNDKRGISITDSNGVQMYHEIRQDMPLPQSFSEIFFVESLPAVIFFNCVVALPDEGTMTQRPGGYIKIVRLGDIPE